MTIPFSPAPHAVPGKLRQRIAALISTVAVVWPLASEKQGLCGGPPRPPNIVVILADDLGWADLGCCGSKYYETPHIDQLARTGMRFTDYYAACNYCSPTRASILTGKYPARLHLTNFIPGTDYPYAKLCPPPWTKYLPREEVTLATALRAKGYATAMVGKWHLGGAPYRPEGHGFDFNFGGCYLGMTPSYFWPYKIPVIAAGRPGEYLTDRLSDEAIKFVENHRDRPFFLYLAHYTVHVPLQAKQEMIAKYRAKLPPAKAKLKPGMAQNNPVYAAMIESLDQGVGRLLAKLDALALSQRTIVVFTSDNGGYMGATSNAPLRGFKGERWEGGIRDPLIVRWPGAVAAGSLCREPAISNDLYPTLLQIAGVTGDPKHNAHVDGVSLVPLLKQQGSLQREALYWHYPHYNIMAETPHGIIRQGDYKLIESYEDGKLGLYDLRKDRAETKNLAAMMPAKAAALRDKLHRWREDIGAQMPTPNPDYDPARAGRSGFKKAAALRDNLPHWPEYAGGALVQRELELQAND